MANFIGQTNVFSGTVESVSTARVTLRTARARASKRWRPKETVEAGSEAHAAVRPEKVRFGDEGDNVVPRG